MDCKTARKLLDEFVDATLPDEMMRLVDDHLGNCEVCRIMMEQQRKISSSMSGLLGSSTGCLSLTPGIQKDIVSAMQEAEHALPLSENMPLHDMMKLFETLTFREKVTKVLQGLKQPKESGDYKWARLQLLRLWSPAMGVAVPVLVVLLAVLLSALAPARSQRVEVRIAETEVVEELKEVEPLPEPEVIPEPDQIVDPTETTIPSTSISAPGPDADFSPMPAQFDSVAIIRSPVVMKGVFGSRSPGARGSALGKFGGGGHTEGAVLRALRWLKKYQETDGSWNGKSGNSPDDGTHKAYANGMTGLALLAYLAHGDTPASPEFGKTIEKALRWVMDNQAESGRWKVTDRCYSDAICAYALCEAYSMTKIPEIRKSAEKAIEVIIRGQHPNGGWDYEFQQSNRDDTSVMAWCTQALKAAKMAGLANPGLEAALKNAVNGFKKNYNAGGFWGYTSPNDSNNTVRGHLTGAGVLCLQLLGAANSPEAKAGVLWNDQNVTFDWQKPWGSAAVYNWYYITQSQFHAGGEAWRNWNKRFSVPLVNSQIVMKGAGAGGKDIGYWTVPAGIDHCKAYVYSTTLCTLMLEVYYRYLPTFQKPEELAAEAAKDAGGEPGGTVQAQDLDISVKLDG